jgi:hypothetical protein
MGTDLMTQTATANRMDGIFISSSARDSKAIMNYE